MVKCADCGFLAVRRLGSSEIVEAWLPLREKGNMSPDCVQLPLCFVREVDLARETESYRQPPDTSIESKHRVPIIQKDRECKGFTPWDQGFSPKEHAEMLLHEQLREAGRKWREEQARRDQQWREQQTERDRQWREEDRKKIETNANRRTIWAVVLSVIAAVVAAVLTPLVQAWLSS